LENKLVTHRFVCDICNEEVFDTNTIVIHKCSICGKDMRWDLSPSTTSRGDFYHESMSLGCRPGQLAEMQKTHPGAEFKPKGKGYVMVTRSVKELDQRLKERGMVKFTKNDLKQAGTI
jgi:hypothetical protein